VAQATLSTASALQAKSGGVRGGPVSIGLDSPCTAGSTVTVELWAGGIAFADFAPGYAGAVPDGFQLDGCTTATTAVNRFLYTFRKTVTAGEQSWSWNSLAAPLDWLYRVTEWNADLEPVSPLEGYAGDYYAEPTTPNPPATFSTGTAPSAGNTNRASVVALACHMFRATAGTFSFSNLTGGFDQRDALSNFTPSGSAYHYWTVWSWKFAQAVGQFECTASCARTGAASGDNYASLVTVYAATTYA
jgi:hypothetical protein